MKQSLIIVKFWNRLFGIHENWTHAFVLNFINEYNYHFEMWLSSMMNDDQWRILDFRKTIENYHKALDRQGGFS